MPDERTKFCACSFIGNAYVLGGALQGVLNSCLMFSPADCSWKEVAEMSVSRFNASCAVFEGKIVVCGGFDNETLNTVETYDHVAKSWINMPNMINGRSSHKSASVKNKLFLVEGDRANTCEVYDSTCKKFVLFKSPGYHSPYYPVTFPDAVISIGSKIYVFHSRHYTCFIYDIENDTWSEKQCKVSRRLLRFSCVKVPQC